MARTRTVRSKSSNQNYNLLKGLMPVINGVLCASALTIVAIVALAVLLRYGIVPETIIPVFNQAVKVIAIALAAFTSVRAPSENPWFRGLVAGILYIIAGVIIFSLITRNFSVSLSNLADIGMGAIIGAVIALLFAKTAKK